MCFVQTKADMKKILCLLILLALGPGVHAGDKKKKSSGQAHSAASKAGGGGGGGAGMKHQGYNAFGGQHAQTGGNHPGGMKHQNSNAFGGQHAQTGGHKAGGNPLMRNNSHANHNHGELAHQGNMQGHAGNNKLTGNKNGSFKGQQGVNNHLGKYSGNHVSARGYHYGYHANYHVQPYRQVFHGYHRTYHDRYWYHHNYDRLVIVGGGNYYWDGGYWYPAWGYNPAYNLYAYDGPIYSYDNLPPDEVIVNVQTALQDEGYYTGDVDGQLGQQTRDALAAYQQDHDLEVTSAVDEPTVEALGLGS
jgi:hypothetical protein